MLKRTRKEVLIVDAGRGELDRGLAFLEQLSFGINHVTEATLALGVVRSSPSFALVAIDGHAFEDEGDANALLQEIRQKDPETPVVWLNSAYRSVPEAAGMGPDLVLTSPCSPQMMKSQCLRALKRRFFPEPVSKSLQHSIQTTLNKNLNCDVKSEGHYLKCDSLASGPISAMVALMGPNFNGSLIISGHRSFFVKCHENLLPGNETPKAGDIAGELTNMLAGEFRAAILSLGLELDHSFPIVVEAHPVSLGYGGPGRLSLVESFSNQWGSISVEFCIDELPTEAPEEKSVPQLPEPGILCPA